MRIIGCDLHTRQQAIAMLDTETGELVERISARSREGEGILFFPTKPGPGRHRSHRIDALVSEADGRAED